MAANVAPSCAARCAASAVSRTTVKIVPSIGFNTASYAATLAAFNASANLVAVGGVFVRIVAASPRKIWLRITPLFPRAPINDPWLIASHVVSNPASAPSSSATTASNVRVMLVPVSPSGTGYTFSRLMPSWWARMVSRKVITVSRKASAPNCSSTGIDKSYRIGAPSQDRAV